MRALPVLLVAALVAGCGGAATTEVDGVQDILADEAERGFSGVVLVRYHGRILAERGYGVADRERDIPVRPDSAFELASITPHAYCWPESKASRESCSRAGSTTCRISIEYFESDSAEPPKPGRR